MTDLALRQCVLDLLDLDLAEAFDLQEVTTSCCMYRGDSVVAIGLELRDVTDVDAVGLNSVDVDDVAILWVLSGTRLLNW